MKEIRITKEQARRYLVDYHCLNDGTRLRGKEGVMTYFGRAGCVQFDPLNVIGHNQELVLRARVADFTPEMLNELLYSDRLLYDQWDKNMSVCPVSDWPYFSHYRKRYLPWCGKYAEAVHSITAYLQEHECACSSDFEMEERVGWHYGPQRLAKAALEGMCYAGLAVVHHKKGTRRHYGLAEKYIPPELFTMQDPNDTPEKYYEWFVRRRMNSVGLMWNRPSDAWLGVNGFKAGERNRAFTDLLEKSLIIPILIEGVKDTIYIPFDSLPILENALKRQPDAPSARILAPLDNMLWDRRLVKAVFNFDYKWEVYTPIPQRKYGYYVLPILYGENMVARFEPEKREKGKEIRIKNIWWEDGVDAHKEMKDAVEKYIIGKERSLK